MKGPYEYSIFQARLAFTSRHDLGGGGASEVESEEEVEKEPVADELVAEESPETVEWARVLVMDPAELCSEVVNGQ